MPELKIGRKVAFENWNGKYTGHRIGKVTKIIGSMVTVQLASGVKKRIKKEQIKGVVWFKKIRPLEE